MRLIIRAIGYTGALQTMTMPVGYRGNVTAYLWGGGGGGGGNDSHPGGTGGGGGFSRITFNVQSGQVITVAVGGGGGGGLSGRRAGGGGAGGGSYTGVIFNTRYPPAGPAAVEAVTWRDWRSGFMNANAVWNSGGVFSGRNFNRSYSVNFPITGLYSFYCAADNIATVRLDGVPVVVTADSFNSDPPPTLSNVLVTAGIHTISWEAVNTGGPGGFALRVTQNNIDGYGGGRGGNAGGSGTSGGGGGGGGATVLFVGSDLQAIAAGGAGGGGGGNNSIGNGENAPGTAGQAIQYTTNGQNGQDKSGDGGGGGGGGGGDRGGNGGATVGGDSGALAGAFGLSAGSVIDNPVGRTPGNQSSVYYAGFAGLGGERTQAGNGGYAVLEIEPDNVQVYQFGQWNPSTPYVNDQGVWKEVQGVFLKDAGVWKPVTGTNSNYAPAFVVSPTNENFGTNSRTTDGGNGGGGGKIICNKLAQLGYFDPAMNAADQQFGRELKVKDPAAYHGYLRWAQTVVDLMDGQGSERLRRWVLFWQKDAEKRVDIQKRIVIYYMNLLARPWAEEMAYRMQAPGYTQSNPAGKLIMNIGMPLNRVVSRLNGKQLPLPVKILTIWGTVSVLLAAVTVITITHNIGNRLKSWFK